MRFRIQCLKGCVGMHGCVGFIGDSGYIGSYLDVGIARDDTGT